MNTNNTRVLGNGRVERLTEMTDVPTMDSLRAGNVGTVSVLDSGTSPGRTDMMTINPNVALDTSGMKREGIREVIASAFIRGFGSLPDSFDQNFGYHWGGGRNVIPLKK